jgi:hypothetical protein
VGERNAPAGGSGGAGPAACRGGEREGACDNEAPHLARAQRGRGGERETEAEGNRTKRLDPTTLMLLY